MMKKSIGLCKKSKRTLKSVICMAGIIIMIGSTAACAGKNDNVPSKQEGAGVNESQQGTTSVNEGQQGTGTADGSSQGTASANENQQGTGTASANENQQGTGTAPADGAQQNAAQSQQGSAEQISLEEAKQAALADAGVSEADVMYTKEKLDYEDGIAVYEIEFYAGNVEYEYEINAATGAVYSKSMETHRTGTEHGHNEHNNHTGTSDAYMDAESVKSIALSHAGVSEEEVSFIESKFDMDDGQAVYEVEFYKDGKEYDYKINAIDGSIIEFDVDFED